MYNRIIYMYVRDDMYADDATVTIGGSWESLGAETEERK
jgi:hypothetical protein